MKEIPGGPGKKERGIMLEMLRRIPTEGGDILKVLNGEESSFAGFGEAYFSIVRHDYTKSWRRHRRAILNLVVPVGEVKFVTTVNGVEFSAFTLSGQDNYGRLKVPAGTWFAFRGIGLGENLILCISSISHDPSESQSKDLDSFPYEW